MSSAILDFFGINTDTLFFTSKMNLYHSGDTFPFANIVIEDGVTRLKVNTGETLPFAASVNVGRYAKP